ncbi:hypothetical protein [Mangrovicoccus ximenensis]|uniref:hypothetical protein n=1 Tax=Mangrovicoccus ximenensis TaxID=1911570 RepID=UPI000D376A57|nr:hypothetical protein [Mangrovicoccus ximenensis]
MTTSTDSAARYDSVQGIFADSVNGATLAGATVTATFADGVSQTGTLAATRATRSALPLADFDFGLAMAGSTYRRPFIITNTAGTALVSLAIDLADANSVFDLTNGGRVGTPGSSLGRTVTETGDTILDGTVAATYSGIVSVGGAAAAGDLFTQLTLDFSGTAGGGLASGTSWNFIADTDTVRPGDLQLAAVPLPAAALPFGLVLGGLAGLAGLRRRTA